MSLDISRARSVVNLSARSIEVSKLRLETKGSRFESLYIYIQLNERKETKAAGTQTFMQLTLQSSAY